MEGHCITCTCKDLNTKFWNACANDDMTTVGSMIGDGLDLKHDRCGSKALEIAYWRGNSKMVEFFDVLGFTNAYNSFYDDYSGHDFSYQMALLSGLTSKDFDNCENLEYPHSGKTQVENCQKLLQSQIRNVYDDYNIQRYIVNSGDTNLLSTILETCSLDGYDKRHLLKLALENYDGLEMFKMLHNNNIRVVNDGVFHAIHRTVNIEIVKYLLDNDYIVYGDDYFVAIRCDRTDILDLLVQFDKNNLWNDFYIFKEAGLHGSIGVIDWFINQLKMNGLSYIDFVGKAMAYTRDPKIKEYLGKYV
jgi:hypothetical protein